MMDGDNKRELLIILIIIGGVDGGGRQWISFHLWGHAKQEKVAKVKALETHLKVRLIVYSWNKCKIVRMGENTLHKVYPFTHMNSGNYFDEFPSLGRGISSICRNRIISYRFSCTLCWFCLESCSLMSKRLTICANLTWGSF